MGSNVSQEDKNSGFLGNSMKSVPVFIDYSTGYVPSTEFLQKSDYLHYILNENTFSLFHYIPNFLLFYKGIYLFHKNYHFLSKNNKINFTSLFS